MMKGIITIFMQKAPKDGQGMIDLLNAKFPYSFSWRKGALGEEHKISIIGVIADEGGIGAARAIQGYIDESPFFTDIGHIEYEDYTEVDINDRLRRMCFELSRLFRGKYFFKVDDPKRKGYDPERPILREATGGIKTEAHSIKTVARMAERQFIINERQKAEYYQARAGVTDILPLL